MVRRKFSKLFQRRRNEKSLRTTGLIVIQPNFIYSALFNKIKSMRDCASPHPTGRFTKAWLTNLLSPVFKQK